MSKILVIGLNPAWQKILEFNDFKLGKVNRAKSITELASGKGINVTKVINRLKEDVSLFQIIGGETGKKVQVKLEEENIKNINYRVDETTRTCTTLLNENKITEIIDPFLLNNFNSRDIGNLIKTIDSPEIMIISGSIPNGCPINIYETLLDLINPKKLILDTVDGVTKSVLFRANCIKVNLEEWGKIKKTVSNDIEGLCVGITHGKHKAYFRDGDGRLFEFIIPKMNYIVNTIGAGDAVTGVLGHIISKNGKIDSGSFAEALAGGCASCETLEPSKFYWPNVEKIRLQININENENLDIFSL